MISQYPLSSPLSSPDQLVEPAVSVLGRPPYQLFCYKLESVVLVSPDQQHLC